ncbi:MAG: branched-chain amino acid ABC transporter permease [Candidatus Symbiobacter sp.]|nr:branched-chain amino acid ABC transporter permease [Candidatus Symbiobacter sp.]
MTPIGPYILQILFDSLTLGSLYAMGALGIALIFGVMRLVNFAHGNFVAFCVFALLVPSTEVTARVFLGALPTPLLILVILAIGAGLSMASEIIVFRHIRQANPVTMMIASFATGFTLQYILLFLFSSRPKTVDLWAGISTPVTIAGAHIPLLQLITIGVTLVLLLSLTWLLRRTQFGIEMRGAAEDFMMARLLGVRANRIILAAFAVSGFLAASIGLILVAQSGTADIKMGLPIMLVAFVSTVIGGMGNLFGAVMAGFLVGLVTTLLQVTLPLELRGFRDALVYAAVILMLLWRPQGLFASATAKERV